MLVQDDSMSPRDWFQLQRTVHNKVTVNSGVSTPLAIENADRICLMIVCGPNTNILLSPYSTTDTTNGYQLVSNGIFQLTLEQHFKLCQEAWYGIPTAMAGTAIVWEVILDRTPAEYRGMAGGRRNASVPSRGASARSDNRLSALGTKSSARWADNLRAFNESLHNLIRRRSGSP